MKNGQEHDETTGKPKSSAKLSSGAKTMRAIKQAVCFQVAHLLLEIVKLRRPAEVGGRNILRLFLKQRIQLGSQLLDAQREPILRQRIF